MYYAHEISDLKIKVICVNKNDAITTYRGRIDITPHILDIGI